MGRYVIDVNIISNIMIVNRNRRGRNEIFCKKYLLAKFS